MKNLGPTLNLGFTKVAAAAGKFVDGFLKLLAQPATAKFFDMLFSASATIVNVFGPALTGFVKGLLDTAQASLPTLVWLATELAKWHWRV